MSIARWNPKEAGDKPPVPARDLHPSKVANPDYLHRVKAGEPLVEYNAKKHLGTLI
ncbi:MAG: hypothetical protein WBZ33_10395 [Thermoactinomyces sp.]